ADKLMESKLWTRALERLETMPPFSSPEDASYRLFDLGVVNEALAYQAEDLKVARKDLQEASIDYGKAIDAKPTEKYFLQPQTRIDTALAHYKVLSEDAKSSHVEPVSSARTSPARSVSSSSAPAEPAGDALTNDQVIELIAG